MTVPTRRREIETVSLQPLTSYVLRVLGQPARLRFELLDLRSGERRVFRRPESVMEFLERNGLRPDVSAIVGGIEEP